MLLSPITIFSQIFLFRRVLRVSLPSMWEIILGFIMFLIAKVQKVITSYRNESETRITLHYTRTHYTPDCRGPVLCTSAARLRKDELTCDSQGRNESEIYKDCDVTKPPGTFSPWLPVRNQISLEIYETGKG